MPQVEDQTVAHEPLGNCRLQSIILFVLGVHPFLHHAPRAVDTEDTEQVIREEPGPEIQMGSRAQT